MNALVNRIIDRSCVDGPGNRTAIFLQGCNFHCSYCHNPETIGDCNHCGRCVPTCQVGALSMREGVMIWEASACQECDACLAACPQSASPKTQWMTVAQVMKQVEKNQPFIRGITVSGGECSLQRDFLLELFRIAKQQGLSTLMDSNGSLPIAEDLALMAVCDGVMLDIKCTDPVIHLSLTGQSVEPVLKNAVALAKLHKLAEVRTVVIPSQLPNEETVHAVCKLLSPYISETAIRYKLIGFRSVGVRGEARGFLTPSREYLAELSKIVRQAGFSEIVI